ncbi:MAG: NAD+ synthase [Flavobacteriales bacterium]
MKVALCQLNYHIGDFEGNTEKIVNAIHFAKDQDADLAIFSELSVCGYPPRDFLEFNSFIEKASKSVHKIARECDNIKAIVGAPYQNPKEKGKKLYNSAYLLGQKKILSVHHKGLLPTYDIFDEKRYFENGEDFKTENINGKKVAITICEDIWNEEEGNIYQTEPLEKLYKENPEIIINISASPFNHQKSEKRANTLNKNAKRYNTPIIYVNQTGGNTELIFDGGSCIINNHGQYYHTSKHFGEDLNILELNDLNSKNDLTPPKRSKSERIYNALLTGIRDYFEKSGFKTAVIGLSGGIDSAMTAALASRALGNNNVRCVLMPSKYSSDHSVTDSERLIKNLGCRSDHINVEDIHSLYIKTLNEHFNNEIKEITEENIQARLRAVLLMAISNNFNEVLLNTTNKSEAAVGYGTLYGDMCGGLSVIGDVYKTELYELADYINKNIDNVIPKNILQKAPSAELKPNQKDTDTLPDYETLDSILYRYIEERKSNYEIIKEGFDDDLVNKVLNLINKNEYKRYQTPPILRVSPKAFGIGRRMPIVADYG